MFIITKPDNKIHYSTIKPCNRGLHLANGCCKEGSQELMGVASIAYGCYFRSLWVSTPTKDTNHTHFVLA